jgi:hypothetical protein
VPDDVRSLEVLEYIPRVDDQPRPATQSSLNPLGWSVIATPTAGTTGLGLNHLALFERELSSEVFDKYI